MARLPAYIKRAIKSGPPIPARFAIHGFRKKTLDKMSKGEQVCAFIEQHLKVPEGRLVGQPIKLDDFQILFVLSVFGFKIEDEQARRAILAIARKNGKALALDTPIPVPGGFKLMADLRVGDSVLSPTGTPVRIIAQSEVFTEKQCYNVTFDDGSSVTASAGHLWKVRVGGMQRKWKTLDTAELFRIKASLLSSIAMPMALPAQHEEKELPIDPYILGCWLGDGTTASASMTTPKPEVPFFIEQFKETGEPIKIRKDSASCLIIGFTDGNRNRADLTKMQARLRALGVLNNKHIPDVYLTASEPQRWALLQGLMDTDGSCDIGNGHPRCSNTQKVKRLADDLTQLARSLGLKASCKERVAKCNGKAFKVNRVEFNAYSDQCVFRMPRKQERLPERPESPTRASFRYVKAVDKVDPVPVQCIQVDSPDGLFLCGKGYAVTHNSALIACIVIAALVGPVATQNSQIVSGAMSREQAALVFKAASKIISLSPDITPFIKIVPSKKQLFGLPMGTEYQALAADGATAQGLSPVLAILDESGQVKGPMNDFIGAILTAQGAHEHPLSIIISTQSASDADFLSVQIDDAIATGDPKNVCHVYEADKDCDLLDERQWLYANPALGSFRSVEDLREQLTQATRLPQMEAENRNKLLNQRIALEALWLSPSVWKQANAPVDLDVFKNNPVHMGLDLSKLHDLTAGVLAARDYETGIIHLLPLVFCPTEGIEDRSRRDRTPYDTWVRTGHLIPLGGRTMDYDQICRYIDGFLSDNDISISSVQFDRWRIDDFKKVCSNYEFGTWMTWEPVAQYWKDISPRCEVFMNLLLEGKLQHGGHPLLTMAASNAIAKSDHAGNVMLDKSKSTQRIDPLIAAVMAVYPASVSTVDDQDYSWWIG